MPVEYADYDTQKYIPSSPMRGDEMPSPGTLRTPVQEEYATRKETVPWIQASGLYAFGAHAGRGKARVERQALRSMGAG